MVEHKYIAALAVLVVLVVVGSGFMSTGNVAISNPTSHRLNLYANSVDFPVKFVSGMSTYHGTATVTNTGSNSVTFVNYEITLTAPNGASYVGKQGWFNINAGETKTFDLPDMDLNGANTYSYVFKIDTDDRYIETDETDNTYAGTFTVRY